MGAELVNRGDEGGPKQGPDYKAYVGDVIPHPDLYRQWQCESRGGVVKREMVEKCFEKKKM